jgi:hypothetical protein
MIITVYTHITMNGRAGVWDGLISERGVRNDRWFHIERLRDVRWSGCILDVVVRGDPGPAQRSAENVVQEIDHGSRNGE